MPRLLLVASRDDEVRRFQEALGAALRARRERQKLSQEGLGFRCGLDRTYISGVERGVRNPTVRTLLVIASALETKPSSLLARAERAVPSS